MSVIPNRLHFVWVGTNLPDRHARNVLNWVLQNPMYDIYLWTETHQMETQLGIILEILQEFVTQSRVEGMELEPVLIGKRILLYKNGEEVGKLYLGTIAVIPPMEGSETIFYEEHLVARNYGVSGDFLRMWVLYEFGGIYSDLDVFPVAQPLPLNIVAPKGVLFATSEKNDRELMNSFMATDMGFDKLKIMVQMQVKAYRGQITRKEKEGVEYWEVSDWYTSHCAQLNRDRARRDACAPDDPRRATFQHSIASLITLETVFRTGPLQVWKWLGTVDGVRMFTEDVDDYSFPRQTGYNPIVGSEESWVC